MEVKVIWAVLQADATLDDTAAKSGFLQWALDLPAGVSARDEAERALREVPDGELTESATAFQELLEACRWQVLSPRRRRRRVVH